MVRFLEWDASVFSKISKSVLVIFVMFSAPLGGCFGNSTQIPDSSNLEVSKDMLLSGEFQVIELKANLDLSVFVPYLILDTETGYVQNSTVIDLKNNEEVVLEILVPPRVENLLLMIGEMERDHWPIRSYSESWPSWELRGGGSGGDSQGAVRIADENSTYDSVEVREGIFPDSVYLKWIDSTRPMVVSVEEGGVHSSGFVNGKIVYETLFELTDPTVTLDPIDGRAGYYDRWAGQGNPAYEDAALFLIDEFESFGLEVVGHRFEFTDIFGNQNPESYNICAYKWGELFVNEWLVFGAHFDVAPPANLVLLDPHVTGIRTYGTRVGAYDNSAGTAMVLETAKALSEVNSRRTMVFCLWSGEEGGKRGSDYWTDYYVREDNPDVTITNYINLDMAGVNWPGGGGAPHGDPDPQIDEDGYPKDAEVWPMRVYIGPGPNHDRLDQPGMVGLSNWIGSDALGLEEQLGILVGVNYSVDTWKTDVWLDMDRPEIIVYEDTTARSDHASFQDNLGTVTIGFGGLVDGYWCYHQTCDTLEEMEQWMDTTGKNYGEENTGVANVINSLDMITWWALLTFFHCDEVPIINAL